MLVLVIVVALIAYACFHLGHAHANYRHGRGHGRRGVNLFWLSARGPYMTIPGPFGTPIGHRPPHATRRPGPRANASAAVVSDASSPGGFDGWP